MNKFEKTALRAQVLDTIYKALDESQKEDACYHVWQGCYANAWTSEKAYKEEYGYGSEEYLGDATLHEIEVEAYKKSVVEEVLKALEKML